MELKSTVTIGDYVSIESLVWWIPTVAVIAVVGLIGKYLATFM